jgi:hypothetical protein
MFARKLNAEHENFAWHGSGDNTNTSSTLIYTCAAVLRKLNFFIKINQTSPICI